MTYGMPHSLAIYPPHVSVLIQKIRGVSADARECEAEMTKLIALVASVQGRAQTPEQAWSTFLGNNRPDLQPNRIRIEYLEPSNKDLLPVYWVMMRRRPLQRIREISARSDCPLS